LGNGPSQTQVLSRNVYNSGYRDSNKVRFDRISSIVKRRFLGFSFSVSHKAFGACAGIVIEIILRNLEYRYSIINITSVNINFLYYIHRQVSVYMGAIHPEYSMETIGILHFDNQD